MSVLLLILGLLVLLLLIGKPIQEERLINTSTEPHRGNDSERDLVLSLLQNNFHKDAIFHDLYLQKRNGTFAQIDLVLATPVGLIVFEVKEYSGWIYGNCRSTYWTQVLSYGKKKYRLYNPVLQNQRHIEELRKKSPQFLHLPMYSVVLFDGNCELKAINHVPNNTFVIQPYELIDTLDSIIEHQPKALYSNKREVMQILSTAKSNGNNDEILNQHIQYVEDVKRSKNSLEGEIYNESNFNPFLPSLRSVFRWLRN